ncbi:MAG: ABC transporter permease subunit [Candidatus Hermodarchaeota archaeon]
MVNVIVEICKKELKTRFGSKRVILPMVPSIGIPILAFVPQLLVYISQAEPESVYLTFLMFLIIPVMITTLVGINTFINEIRWKTIKSLLAAPVSEEEIFIGKSLACIITGLLAEVFLSGIILIYLQNIDISIVMLLIAV